jgi:hypothetical protein
MAKVSLRSLMTLGVGLAFSATASAQRPFFYEDKTIRIVVGFGPRRWPGYLFPGHRAAYGQAYQR